jgi:hypothetical protein
LARQEPEEASAGVAAARRPGVLAEQVEPVLLVSALGVGEREQDLSFLALPPRREVAIDTGLGSLGREIPPPAPNLGRGGLAGQA